MFKKSPKGYYFWEEFAKIDGIAHGFSTRKFGDMNIKNPSSYNNLRMFIKSLGVNNKNVVRMSQVHGNSVFFASSKDNEKIIEACDGLLAYDANVFLVGTFADCVPVLFLDIDKKILGITHTGWKGVYKKIVKAILSKMISKGSNPSDLLIGIGPSIRVCCYNIDEEREKLFKDKFPKTKNAVIEKNHKIFLDLIVLIKHQLSQCHIPKKNILDCKICTKDNMSEFYSLRGENGNTSYGLSSAVIGRL